MRKIAFLKSNIEKRGGLEKYTLRLANCFAKAGHQVTLLTTNYHHEHVAKGEFKIANLGNKIPLSFLQLLRFDRRCKTYLKQQSQDVIFGMDRNFCAQTHYRAGNGCHAAYLDRRREYDSWFKVKTFSLNPLHQLILNMERATFESRSLQTLFVNSEMVRQEILRYYPSVDAHKICVVHNGVEWNELQRPFDEGLNLRPKILKQLGRDSSRYQFLFVGNEYERKGLKLLLKALSIIPEKRFELTVIGKERRPESFYEQAKSLGLQDRVHFIGAVNEVKVFYSAADALVIPSIYDPFANVTVEALAMGLFVISSSSNGGSEVLTKESGRIFSDLKSPHELALCLQEAMSQPKTKQSASFIRQQVAHLDFSIQIQKIISKTLNDGPPSRAAAV